MTTTPIFSLRPPVRLLLCAMIAAASLSAPASERTLKTADGKTLQGELRLIEPDGLTISLHDGVRKIPFEQLSREVRDEFQFEPAKARQYARDHAEALAGQLRMQEEAVKRLNAKATPTPAATPAPKAAVSHNPPLLMNQGVGAKSAPEKPGLSIGRLGGKQ